MFNHKVLEGLKGNARDTARWYRTGIIERTAEYTEVQKGKKG